jgi:diguanylate cyclase (GGDEF)-like protein
MSNNNNYNVLEHGFDIRISPRAIPELVWFYGLWTLIASISAILGHSTISNSAGLFLLGGICSTNFFFLLVKHTERYDDGLARFLTTAQTILAIAWASAYFYFAQNAGELVLGMYMTVLMFAVFQLDRNTFVKLALGTLASYLLIVAVKLISLPALVTPLQDGVRFLILASIACWAYVYRNQLSELRNRLQDRNEELQRLVDQVSRIAAEDELTKSYNRRYLLEILAREKSRASRLGKGFSILLFDLDDFKSINDRYGHLVGDQVLHDFAERVKKELRGIDSVSPTEHRRSFGRYGGEEFIAVLPGTDLLGAKQVAERVRRIVYEHAFREIYKITVSIGVAEYQPGETIPQLLSRADQALYQAKRDGRNRVRCNIFHVNERRNDGPKLRVLK